MVVAAKNIFHAALFLAAALFGVAAIYVLLAAYFLAAIQVLIYVGAVVVLTIFVINLTRDVKGEAMKLVSLRMIPALLVTLLAVCLIGLILIKADFSSLSLQPAQTDSTVVIGKQLLGDFVLPFELVSVLLLAALIAAVVIVSKDAEEEK